MKIWQLKVKKNSSAPLIRQSILKMMDSLKKVMFLGKIIVHSELSDHKLIRNFIYWTVSHIKLNQKKQKVEDKIRTRTEHGQ